MWQGAGGMSRATHTQGVGVGGGNDSRLSTGGNNAKVFPKSEEFLLFWLETVSIN